MMVGRQLLDIFCYFILHVCLKWLLSHITVTINSQGRGQAGLENARVLSFLNIALVGNFTTANQRVYLDIAKMTTKMFRKFDGDICFKVVL